MNTIPRTVSEEAAIPVRTRVIPIAKKKDLNHPAPGSREALTYGLDGLVVNS